MSGGRLNPGLLNPCQPRHLWPVSTFVLSVLLACGGERGSGVGAVATSRPDSIMASPKPDTSIPGPAPAKTSRQTATARNPVAPASKPPVPAPQPTAPAPKPAAPAAKPQAPSDSATAAAPPADTAKAAPSQASDANTSLRDEYHRAPVDTVSQQVYTGWKQFNLNCSRCHGEDVQGTTIAPHLVVSLRPDGPINTKELFVQTVCAGRPAKGMPAWCALGLEMDKIEAIYSYVKGRSDSKIHAGRPAVKPEG